MLTAERLRAVINYDAAAGVFTRPNGRSAGCTGPNGYVVFHVDGRLYAAHRLAWLHVYGEWPPHDIDHINGHRSDNRIANLRCATRSQNLGNRRCLNKTGLKGVSVRKGAYKKPYGAQITKNGKPTFLGWYATPHEAHAAYCAAALKVHGEFARFA